MRIPAAPVQRAPSVAAPLASGRPIAPVGPAREPAPGAGPVGAVVLRRATAVPAGTAPLPLAALDPRTPSAPAHPYPSPAPPAPAAPPRAVPLQRLAPTGTPPFGTPTPAPTAPEPTAPPAPVPSAPSAAPPPSTPIGPPEPAQPTQADLDALARRLLAPLSRLLRAELRGDRERIGRLRDR
ncbi:hypothetical protein AB0P12_13350 [Streptomyces subrutilus]|uniref:hypothetical protein n=1 Tax=Streptomyces subrutilus TaxID=36818 RepID=UPI00343E9739